MLLEEKIIMGELGWWLGLPAIMGQYASSDCTAIGFCAFELNLKPVYLAGEVVSQKRRGFVKVDDDDVNVAIIIEISESPATAAMLGCNASTRFAGKFLKCTLTQLSRS